MSVRSSFLSLHKISRSGLPLRQGLILCSDHQEWWALGYRASKRQALPVVSCPVRVLPCCCEIRRRGQTISQLPPLDSQGQKYPAAGRKTDNTEDNGGLSWPVCADKYRAFSLVNRERNVPECLKFIIVKSSLSILSTSFIERPPLPISHR